MVHNFNRWPTWMWANWEVIQFIEWLRDYNGQERKESNNGVGFYGLDVYSLGESLEAIMEYLQKADPSAFRKAKAATQCFEPFGYEGSDYARSIRMVPKTCEHEVIDLLKAIQEKIQTYNTDPETVFSTERKNNNSFREMRNRQNSF